MWRLPWQLLKKDRALRSTSIWILLMSLSLGVAALVVLDLFSRRIEATVFRDSKSLLAADFQVQSWRPFDEKVWTAVRQYQESDRLIQQSDFLSSISWKEKSFTVSARTLSGKAYPFYGEWKVDPPLRIQAASILLEDLEAEPSIVLDKSFRLKGINIGDRVRLGSIELTVKTFLQEEPQTVAGAMALGPRVIVHRKWAMESGLMGRGSRVFNQLLIKSEENSEEFKKKFRAFAPDPHWRLITPEHANQQVDKVIARLRGFLSFVALTGLFLGAVGLFMVFRSQFLERLPQFLTLRCLGTKARDLFLYALLQSCGVALAGSFLGVMLGVILESFVARFAQSQLSIELASTSLLPSALLGALISFVGVLTAVLVPMREILSIPLQQVIRVEESVGQGISRKELRVIGLAVLFLVGLIARDVKLGGAFLGIFAGATFFLYGCASALSLMLRKRKFALLMEQARLLYLRKPARSYLIVISVGLSLFFLQCVLMIGHSLRSQLDIVDRAGIPNAFVLGLSAESLPISKNIVPGLEAMPMTQARIVELKGKPIVESDVEEESAERFYQTREYFVTKRNELSVGERLVGAKSLFGEKKEGVVRLSLEKSFADRMNVRVGDAIKIELAGVALHAEVRSFRRVDWFNFRPNFFMVFNADDVEGAPMDFVGSATVPSDQMAEIQARLGEKAPQVTMLDAESLTVRLKKILGQLSFSVLSVSFFSVGSCFFVFLGMMLARRQEMIKEMALYKCLGIRTSKVMGIYLRESTLTLSMGLVVSFLASLISAFLICEFVLDIPFVWPLAYWPLFLVAAVLAVGNFSIVLFLSRFKNASYRELLESVEN